MALTTDDGAHEQKKQVEVEIESREGMTSINSRVEHNISSSINLKATIIRRQRTLLHLNQSVHAIRAISCCRPSLRKYIPQIHGCGVEARGKIDILSGGTKASRVNLLCFSPYCIRPIEICRYISVASGPRIILPGHLALLIFVLLGILTPPKLICLSTPSSQKTVSVAIFCQRQHL